jgi:HD-like signal output (HDOD) protein
MNDINESSKDLKDLIQKMDDLPILPNIISKVMKIIDNPYSNADHLTELISMDQSLTVKTLKLANSAYYGFPREIVTVTEAVVVLGFLTVRNLILTSTLYNIFVNESQEEREFDRRKFWKHSVATAICARLLVSATAPGQKEEEEAFTLGILHDVGKVFLDTNYHADFMSVMRESRKNRKTPLFEAERRVFGIDHAEIGAMIIDRWNLPENFFEPIKYHHTPGEAADKYMTSILHVADVISKFSVANYDPLEISAQLNAEAVGVLKLQEKNLRTTVQNLEYEMSNADLFLNS